MFTTLPNYDQTLKAHKDPLKNLYVEEDYVLREFNMRSNLQYNILRNNLLQLVPQQRGSISQNPVSMTRDHDYDPHIVVHCPIHKAPDPLVCINVTNWYKIIYFISFIQFAVNNTHHQRSLMSRVQFCRHAFPSEHFCVFVFLFSCSVCHLLSVVC